MFERVEAVRFDRLMDKGKTRPMLLSCENETGEEIEVVAKFSEGCSTGGLVREAMAAMLACDLGLPVPAPYLVELSAEFIDAIPSAEVKAFLHAGDTFGFGSHKLPPGFAAWTPAKMSEPMDQEALDIITFDCWLTNPDRHVANHNLLSDGNRFAIFDHEHALMTELILFWQPPWIVDSLTDKKPPVDHVFYDPLRGRSAYPLEPLCARMAAIPDARIAEYVDALPPSWASADDSAAKACAFIVQLRNNAAPAGAEVRRVLS